MSGLHRPARPWRPSGIALAGGGHSDPRPAASWLRRARRHRWWVSIPEPLGLRVSDDLLVVLVIDESGSTGTTDPLGLRHLDARLALRFLRRHGHGRDDHAAVIHFADQPVLACPPTPLRRGYRRLARRLSRPTITGGTAFVPALELAVQLCLAETERRAGSGRRRLGRVQPNDGPVQPLVLWFTDGLTGEPLGAIADALAPLGADHVHLVALDHDGTFAAAQPAFGALGLGSIWRLRRIDGAAFELALGRVLVDELGMVWGSDDKELLAQGERR